MTKEEKLKERALELYYSHKDWGMKKALAAACTEEYLKRKERKKGKFSIRQVGLLEYWD